MSTAQVKACFPVGAMFWVYTSRPVAVRFQFNFLLYPNNLTVFILFLSSAELEAIDLTTNFSFGQPNACT